MFEYFFLFRSSVKTGRAKRNATFPGGIATTYTPQYANTPTPAAIQTPPVKCESGGESSGREEISTPSLDPPPDLKPPTPSGKISILI